MFPRSPPSSAASSDCEGMPNIFGDSVDSENDDHGEIHKYAVALMRATSTRSHVAARESYSSAVATDMLGSDDASPPPCTFSPIIALATYTPTPLLSH